MAKKHGKSGSHSSSSSDEEKGHHKQPPPVYPPPPHGYPPHPQTGYPPNYPPPQGGYGPYQGYPPPYGGGYPQQQQQHPGYYHPSAGESAIIGCIRCFFTIIVVFMLISVFSTVFALLYLQPQEPVFQVESMSVSKLKAVPTAPLTADWDAQLTVANPNMKLAIYFEQIRISTYYGRWTDYELGRSYGIPFAMPTETATKMPVKFSTNGTEEEKAPAWIVERIAKDRGGGSVNFGLEIKVWTTMKSGSYERRGDLKVYCDNLKIDFVGNSDKGTLAPGKRYDCQVEI